MCMVSRWIWTAELACSSKSRASPTGSRVPCQKPSALRSSSDCILAIRGPAVVLWTGSESVNAPLLFQLLRTAGRCSSNHLFWVVARLRQLDLAIEGRTRLPCVVFPASDAGADGGVGIARSKMRWIAPMWQCNSCSSASPSHSFFCHSMVIS